MKKYIETEINFIFCHGFALDNSYFNSLIENLSKIFPKSNYINIDLGFFGEENIPNFDKNAINIAIGHSLGVNFLYQNRQTFNIHTLISLSGFIQFCFDFNTEDFLKFKNNFKKSPTATLSFFYKNAGLNQPKDFPQKINLTNLEKALEVMQNFTLPENLDIPIISLISSDDRIITTSISQNNFLNNIICPKQTNHSLGTTNINFIIDNIKNNINI